MSTSDPRFRADADSPTTEVGVLDGAFRVVATGLSRVDQALPPGLYLIRCRMGAEVAEEIVEHTAEAPVEWRLDRPLLASPAPLRDTKRLHEYHEDSARIATSDEPTVKLGAGSRLVVFVRDWEAAGRREEAEYPLVGLTIGRAGNEARHDLHAGGVCDMSVPDPYGRWSAEADPGSWILRLDTGANARIEQLLYLSPGWNTWLFAFRSPYERPDGTVSWRADLEGATILLARPGDTLDDRDLKLAEEARAALYSGGAAGEGFVQEMLGGKFQNPILGLYGAHLLRRMGRRDAHLEDVVLRNLRRLLGEDHPDVRALMLDVDPEAEVTPFDFPPMLRASWDIVCRASVRRPDLIPAGSLSAEIAPRLWGSSPLLQWMRSTGGAVPESFGFTDGEFRWTGFHAALLESLAGPALRRREWRARKERLEVVVPAEPPVETLERVGLPASVATAAYREMHEALLRDAGGDGTARTPVTSDRWWFRAVAVVDPLDPEGEDLPDDDAVLMA